MELADRHLVLTVTGGVAAYKAAFLARELQRSGATVQVVMTEAATHFVGTATFQALTGRAVFSDQWDASVPNNMAHIELSRGADAIIVAPATADFLARIALGLADDLASAMCLARGCALLAAPAMNLEMWNNPATVRNVRTLREDGVTLLGPDSGEQACGEVGAGRMLEPEEIVEETIAFFTPKLLAGRRVLVTAGPTFEAIDPVRGITNLSSGKTGFAIARAMRHAGADLTLVAGPTTLATPRGVARVDVRTAREMHDAVVAALESGARTDVFVAVAAVADWRVQNVSAKKLKKRDDGTPPELSFAQNPDILATVAARADAPFCVGFAAESEDLRRNAQAKRKRKGVPLMVANIGHETFGKDESELLLVDAQGVTELARAAKQAQARALVGQIAERLRRLR